MGELPTLGNFGRRGKEGGNEPKEEQEKGEGKWRKGWDKRERGKKRKKGKRNEEKQDEKRGKGKEIRFFEPTQIEISTGSLFRRHGK